MGTIKETGKDWKGKCVSHGPEVKGKMLGMNGLRKILKTEEKVGQRQKAKGKFQANENIGNEIKEELLEEKRDYTRD